MNELIYIYATGAIIAGYFLVRLALGKIDPFESVWMFLLGYAQLYVLQPWTYHDWAVGVRGARLVADANFRILWSLLWFLAVYHLNPFRLLASAIPRPPRVWSPGLVAVVSPLLIVWGLYCARSVMYWNENEASQSPEARILASFPFVMNVAAILLIVTGRNSEAPRPGFTVAGVFTSGIYIALWIFLGKRSPSLIAFLTTLCALYITRLRRPSWTVLISSGLVGVLVVTMALAWRMDKSHPRNLGGFFAFLVDFDPSEALERLNLAEGDGDREEEVSHETEEYGGFLLMMDTVPDKSEYDYGMNYLKAFSTFIPRIVWKDKPIFGREAWRHAWVVGSEFNREDDFASPAIGILGATQLNGGAFATFIVVAVAAATIRAAYDYFLRYADLPWTQFFWSVTYYNAWLMVVTDDPLVWFYFSWGFMVFPLVILTWFVNKLGEPLEAGRPVAVG